ncbi:unnamed protein product [Camellia sinensis]
MSQREERCVMDPIPILLRILWDMWNVRVLVLLSLAFQIILFVFSNCRKYMSSLWINVVVWLAYLLADWVAIVALSKLSNALGDNNNNVFPAIWAPLLLLHLGGPNTITAYSLEDNQLWLRHLMVLGVQATVTIYVIIMSWRKYSWFSYLSLPAFVAGIIFYVERVWWVLKSASDDNLGDIIPFKKKADISLDGQEHKYVRTLVMAQKLVKQFKRYIENYDIGRFVFEFPSNQLSTKVQWREKFTSDDTYFWDSLEVEMGLMYDLFYTKASIMYTKRGCVMHSISFVCTMSVLVGSFWAICRKENWHREHYNYSMIDVTITGVLLFGALALEIYAIIVILASDWTMLWLIEHKKGEWVIQLRRKFPWLYKQKKWSKKVGQFDLLGFCFKQNKPAMLSCRFQEKFDRYMHKTHVVVPPNLYDTILNYTYYWSRPSVVKLDEVAQATLISTMKVLDPHLPAFYELIVIVHLATEICYHLELNITDQRGANSSRHEKQIMETCRTLSHYMMYLLLMCPWALPINLSDTELGNLIHDLKMFIKDEEDVSRACELLKDYPITLHDPYDLRRILLVVQKFMRNFLGWERLRSLWLGMLGFAAIKGDKNYHLQQLRQGGQFLTLLWFFIPQSNILDRIDAAKVGRQINNQ